MEVKDILYIAVTVFSTVLSALVAYFAGRAQNRKTSMEGVILTADKIDEYVSALVKTKLQMHEIDIKLSDCLQDQRKCGELRKRIAEIAETVEHNADDAAQVLKSLKGLIC
jgi:hypothetical protein